MSFAEKQLTKFGWKKGDGLGKNKDGIKKSISVVKKNDTKGLGGKVDKWDFAWWDHVFNKSVSNIKVNKDESGEVKVEKEGLSSIQLGRMGIISTSRPAGAAQPSIPSPAISTPSSIGSMTPRDEYDEDKEKPAPRTTSGPSWLFGFVKASASSAVVEEDKRNNQEPTTSAHSFVPRSGNYDELKAVEAEEYKDYSIKVSDQALFEACEGRTARKGARTEQPGKLGRVMKELLLDNGSEKALDSDKEVKVKSDKKGSKEKKEKKEKREKKEKKENKNMKEKKEKKEKSSSTKDKKSKEKNIKDKTSTDSAEKMSKEKKKSKKRRADENEPRPSKKLRRSKDEY
ncbi:G patch domain-containing protein 4 [Modicella reniformis]|uniref:G patch domain-containing protein 4 n=1 Tax=Modicella reniformis TaxID=1440133 RepID=A0A9P6IQQ8_9FUNG|nr:G patch domain-containing protein 4 [Modicella reniformis]